MQDYRHAEKASERKQSWIPSNIGNLLQQLGLYQEAIEFLNQALEIDPEDSYIHERLAQSKNLQAEEKKKAVELEEEVRRLLSARRNGTQQPPADG